MPGDRSGMCAACRAAAAARSAVLRGRAATDRDGRRHRAFALEAQLTLRLVRALVTFRRLDGTAFEPDYANIHHRDETIFGLADPWLLGRGSWTKDTFTVTGRAGVGLPLGSTEPNPFALGRAGLPHQHVQLGAGVFHPVLAVDASYGVSRFRFGAYAQTLLFLYENGNGYRAGNRYMGGVTAEHRFGDHVRVGVGADILNEQPERWDGVVQQDGNVGRTDLLLGAGASYTADRWLASLAFRSPVFQHFSRTGAAHDADPGQLTYPAIVSLAVQYTFGPSPAASK
jgi:hypothetical protein